MSMCFVRNLSVVLLGITVLFAAAWARADSCVGRSTAPASNEHWSVDGGFNKRGKVWSYILTDRKTGENRIGPLEKCQPHAHLFFYVSEGGRFAVLDASAGHRLNDRFMVYDLGGTFVASLGVAAILNEEEQKKVVHSMNHIGWLKYDSKTKSPGEYVPTQNGVRLTTRSDREVLISLTDGKVIKPGGPQPRQDAARYKALYARYKGLIADAARLGDKAQALKITEQFNDSIGGKLIYAGVFRSGSPLINRSFGREPFPLPAISYDATDSGKVKVSLFDDYFLVETANPRDLDKVRVRLAFAAVGGDAGATDGATGEKAGEVQCRLRTAKQVWKAGEPLKFEAEVWNTGPNERTRPTDPLRRCRVEIDGQWYHWIGQVGLEPGERFPRAAIGRQPTTLPIVVHWNWWDDRQQWLKLPAGKHVVRVAFDTYPAGDADSKPTTVISDAVEIEIVEGKDPAPQAPWGPASEGVQARLRAGKDLWKRGEIPTFKFDMRNRGERELSAVQHEAMYELEFDGHWYKQVAHLTLNSSLFPTGRQYFDIPVTPGEHWQSKTGKKPPPLTVGKHTVRVAFVARNPTLKGPNTPPPVRCVSNAVEIKIDEDSAQTGPDRKTSPGDTPSLKDLLQDLPIVALWRHELHRPSRSDEAAPPNLRIAVWNDGRVLSAQDPGKWGHKLEFGRLTDDALSKIKKQILDTGVFDLKGRLSYLVPSAPVFCLLVQLDGKRRLLCWDEREMSGYGINTNPTPHDLAFIRTWKSVNKLMVSAIPDDSVQVFERFETVPKPWYVERRTKSEPKSTDATHISPQQFTSMLMVTPSRFQKKRFLGYENGLAYLEVVEEKDGVSGREIYCTLKDALPKHTRDTLESMGHK